MQLASLAEADIGHLDKKRTHLNAKSHLGIEVVPIKEVIALIAYHKYVTLHHAGGALLLDESLVALETEFADRMIRIHRNALIARDRIERLERNTLSQCSVYVRRLPVSPLMVSRRHAPSLRKLIRTT